MLYGGFGVSGWVLANRWTVWLVCALMVIIASHYKPYHTGWNPHTSLTAGLCLYTGTQSTLKFSVFIHRCTPDSTQLTVFLLVFGMHWSHIGSIGWVGESACCLSLCFSVCMCLRELNEITVILTDQSECKILILLFYLLLETQPHFLCKQLWSLLSVLLIHLP